MSETSPNPNQPIQRAATGKRNLSAFREAAGFAWAYLCRIRLYVYLAMGVFAAFLWLGYRFGEENPSETANLIGEIGARMGSLAQESSFDTFLAIFGNNLHIDLAIIAFGMLAGLVPLFILMVNAFIIGLFFFYFSQQGLEAIFLLGILPHGILEIPSLWFSAAAGLRIGAAALRKLVRRHADLPGELEAGLRFGAVFILPLTLLAALIETYLTPLFIELGVFFT